MNRRQGQLEETGHHGGPVQKKGETWRYIFKGVFELWETTTVQPSSGIFLGGIQKNKGHVQEQQLNEKGEIRR